MLVNTKDMAGVPVETRSGKHVGKVASFDLDASTGQMMTLHVKSKGLVPGLMSDELLVSWTAVIEMSALKVVIQDGMETAHGKAFARSNSPVTNPTLLTEG